VYALCGCVTIHRLLQLRGPLWVLIFLVALAITLIPTPLLEPRYFTPGVVLAVLNSPPVRPRTSFAQVL
jgi:membrane glycosyltransferase